MKPRDALLLSYTIWRFESATTGEVVFVPKRTVPGEDQYQHAYQRIIKRVMACTPDEAMINPVSLNSDSDGRNEPISRKGKITKGWGKIKKERFIDDYRQLNGLAPYDKSSNQCYGDSYFNQDMKKRYQLNSNQMDKAAAELAVK